MWRRREKTEQDEGKHESTQICRNVEINVKGRKMHKSHKMWTSKKGNCDNERDVEVVE